MNYSSFGKNAFLYAIGTMGIRTASFLLIPIYTYSMSLSDYGLFSVLLQTAQILVIVVNMGSRTALVRFAKEYEDKNEIGVLLGTTVFINFAGALGVTVISALLLLPLFRGVLHTENVARYVLLTCAAASFNCLAFHLMAYYRAGQKGLKVTIASLGGAFSLILVTTIFLRVLHMGIEGALLAQTIIYAALAAVFLRGISSQTKLSVSLPLTWSLMRFGLPLIFVMGGGLITQASAFYFLSYFRGLDQVGIYSLGLKMAQIVEMVLILPFEMAYEPFVYGHIGDPQLWNAISRLLTYIIIAFAFTACGIVFVARDVLPVIAPPAFSPAYLVIFVVLPALAFRAVYYIGESLLFLEKRTDLAGSVVIAFTVLSLALNYLFIWRWGMYGAAAVFVLTTVCTGATVMKLGLRMSPVRIESDRLAVGALLLCGLLAMVCALRGASALVYYSAVPAAVCAAMILLYASRFIKEDEKRVIETFIQRVPRFRSVLDVW
ncbi:MAG TPA: oligosaccharide flippase family protein [Terriglobia bacterium]|nr:oligosaccharide flippase family protein [Terriglobia bacterium]